MSEEGSLETGQLTRVDTKTSIEISKLGITFDVDKDGIKRMLFVDPDEVHKRGSDSDI